jgi:hypothetical protein
MDFYHRELREHREREKEKILKKTCPLCGKYTTKILPQRTRRKQGENVVLLRYR